MSGKKRKPADSHGKEVTRRQMLMRLGLGATAIYAAPVLLQLSEARASSFSAPSSSRPRGRQRRRARTVGSPASFSGPRRSSNSAQQPPRTPRRFASSFSR